MFDSGSEWLAVKMGDTTAGKNAYDPSSSTSAVNTGVNHKEIYGSATLIGTLYKDRVCLQKDAQCVNDFEFLGVTQSEGLVGT